MARLVPLCIAFPIALCACKSPSADAEPAPPAKRKPMEAKPVSIEELDFAPLLRQLEGQAIGLPENTPEGKAVKLVKEFRGADPVAPPASGEELWFGKSYAVNDAFYYLRLRHDTGFGTTLQPDGYLQENDANTLLEAVMEGKAPPVASGSLKYMSQAEPREPFAALTKAKGKSLVVTAQSPLWLRRKGDRLLVLETRSQDSSFRGAGRCAELWKVKR